MNARARLLTAILAGAFALALVAGLIARGSIERALFVRRIERATGLALEVDRIERSVDGYVLRGVRAHTRGGAALLEAARASVRERDGALDVALDGARFTFAPGRLRGDEMRALHDAGIGLFVALHDAALTVVLGDVPTPQAAFEGIAGHAIVGPEAPRYDLRGTLVEAGARFPVVGRADAGDVAATQHWTAASLPVAVLARFVRPDARAHPVGGFLHDVDLVVAGASRRATCELADVSVVLGEHALSGLHGALALDATGVGSRSIVGIVDAGVPFEAAGEVHDAAGVAWLRDGTNDANALARLAETMAAEPRLRSVRLEATAPGLAFGQYALATDHGPLAISLLRIDPHEPTLRFGTAIAEDHVVSGGERTSAMGVRTGAVAGVNGDYFDIGRTYQPQGMLVRDGRLVRGPTDRAALTVDRDGQVRFGEFRMRGSVRTARGTMPITEFNDWPPGYVSVITPDYGRTLHGGGGATFVTLEPLGSGGTRYRVTNVAASAVDPDVSLGIAIGRRVRVPIPKVGETVDVSYATEPQTAGSLAAIGGGPILVRDGSRYEDPHAPAPDERNYRWPVVALAKERDDRLMLVAVDGRHPERSVGATRPEFADILLRLGATEAMALDSGGSVTLVSRAPGDANASVRNVPSDNSAERWVSDALFLYSSAPAPSIVPIASAPTPVPEARPAP